MTQNEKSKIRAKVIKWVTRLFLILVAIIMLYPLAVSYTHLSEQRSAGLF